MAPENVPQRDADTRPADADAASLLAVTAVQWRDYATGDARDAFLASLDATDDAHTIAIARHLVGCGNPLPSATCTQLRIAPGSTYGAGARAILERAGMT